MKIHISTCEDGHTDTTFCIYGAKTKIETFSGTGTTSFFKIENSDIINIADIQSKYQELLGAVGEIADGITVHEAALSFIRDSNLYYNQYAEIVTELDKKLHCGIDHEMVINRIKGIISSFTRKDKIRSQDGR